jgi:hypothetical protein
MLQSLHSLPCQRPGHTSCQAGWRQLQLVEAQWRHPPDDPVRRLHRARRKGKERPGFVAAKKRRRTGSRDRDLPGRDGTRRRRRGKAHRVRGPAAGMPGPFARHLGRSLRGAVPGLNRSAAALAQRTLGPPEPPARRAER